MMAAWANIKAGISALAIAVSNMVGLNIRFGLVTFQDFIVWHRLLDHSPVAGQTQYQCISSVEHFVSIMNFLEMVKPGEGGFNIPDRSAKAIKFVLDGGTWSSIGGWRPGAKKIILLVTATPNDDEGSGLTINEAVTQAAGCGVIVPYVLVPSLELFTPPRPDYIATMVAEGGTCNRITGGPSVRTSNMGIGIKEALMPWFSSLYPVCSLAPEVCVPGPGDVCAVDLMVVLDDTGSMAGVITALKTGIEKVVTILQETIGLNIRLALVTFKDAVTLRYKFFDCGLESIRRFKEALAPIEASGGANEPEYSAAAVKFAAMGEAGAWRDSTTTIRAMLVVTDAINNIASGVSYNEAANIAASNSIRVAYAATPAKTTMAAEGRAYAEITDGIFIATNALGTDLPELLTTFVYGLCASFIPPRACEGGTDHIINGIFRTGIAGWVTYSPPVAWSAERQSMFIGVGGEARQKIAGLDPGDRLVLSARIETLTPGEIFYGTIITTTPLIIEAGKAVSATYTTIVPDSGEVTIKFMSEGSTGSSFYVDNVVA
jgi:hypothetical protein